MPYFVTACVCHNVTFDQLKRLAIDSNLTTFEQLAVITKCGAGCGMCRPYVEHMLQTGETAIPLLDPSDA